VASKVAFVADVVEPTPPRQGASVLCQSRRAAEPNMFAGVTLKARKGPGGGADLGLLYE